MRPTLETRLALICVAIGALSSGGDLAAQRPAVPPSADSLAGITARGRMLAEYDMAAWHGGDAVMALHPDPARAREYVAHRERGGAWTVSFGRIDDTGRRFLIAYVARQSPVRPDSFVAEAYAVPVADSDYVLHAARALARTHAALGPVARPYNLAVIPADDGSWWSYATPAATQFGVWPLGADIRLHVTAAGDSVLATRKLHNSIIEFRQPPGAGRMVAGTHIAVVDLIPEDTDVMYVVERTPRVPEIIVSDAFVFRIDVDGSIKYLGRREDVIGK